MCEECSDTQLDALSCLALYAFRYDDVSTTHIESENKQKNIIQHKMYVLHTVQVV